MLTVDPTPKQIREAMPRGSLDARAAAMEYRATIRRARQEVALAVAAMKRLEAKLERKVRS